MGLFNFFKGETKASAPDAARREASSYTLMLQGTTVFLLNGYSAQQMISHYKTVSPLADAIDRIAITAASLPIQLVTRDSGAEVKDHEIFKLLRNPNAVENPSQQSLFQALITWRLLHGNAYLVATGSPTKPPLELLVKRPQYMTHQSNGTGYTEEFRYHCGSIHETFTRDPRTNLFLNARQNGALLHMSTFNPDFHNTGQQGQSEVMALFFEIEQYLNASQHNLTMLQRGARPSGALVLKNKDGTQASLNEEEFARLKLQMDDQYSGGGNSGRPMLLEGGLEWTEMSITNKDMDWLEGKKDARDQIYRKMRVPLPLITMDAATFNNVREAKAEFYEDRCIPIMEEILDLLNDWLLPRYKGGDRLVLRVDKDDIDALSMKHAERKKAIYDDPTATINEKREELGKPPVQGGDIVVTATGNAICGPDKVDAVAIAPAPLADETQQQEGAAKKHLPFILEEKSFVDVSTAFQDPMVTADFTHIITQMYDGLVTAFGAQMVAEVSRLAEFQRSARVEQWIKQTSGEFIKGVNETTLAQVRGTLAEAILAGETLPEIRDRIEAVFDVATTRRLDTIAMTETTRAAGFTSREALEQAGYDRTVWLAVRDGKTRDAHAFLDGKASDEFGYFHVDGHKTKHPGGFGVAALDINCRCAIRAAFPEEKADHAAHDETLWNQREAARAKQEPIVRKALLRVFERQRFMVLSNIG